MSGLAQVARLSIPGVVFLALGAIYEALEVIALMGEGFVAGFAGRGLSEVSSRMKMCRNRVAHQ